ncbi:MAG: glycosyltransferase family 4 protein [Rhabdochlamydiaceae bacterium]
MNICLVSYELPPVGGGEGTYTYNLARGLSDRGHNVILFVPRHVSKKSSETIQLGNIVLVPVDLVERPFVRVASFMARVIRMMPKISSDWRIELVHFTFDYPALPMNLGFERPVVSTLHHLHYVEALSIMRSNKNIVRLVPYMAQQMLLSYSEKKLMSQSRAVIAVSKFTHDSAIKYAGCKSSNLYIVPNAIDSNLYVEPARGNIGSSFRELYKLGSDRIVLYVGRVKKSKGLEYLIRGFARVCDRVPSAQLVIVGGGDASYVMKLRNEAIKSHIDQRITFTGRIEQTLLFQAYLASEIVSLPSMMEGFGLTLLEAMTVGKPVVATRVGAIPEIIVDKSSGLLVDTGDSSQLAEAILQLLENPDAAKNMGANGKLAVAGNYSIERMAQLTEKVYASVL